MNSEHKPFKVDKNSNKNITAGIGNKGSFGDH
jgi:hypothetical protein